MVFGKVGFGFCFTCGRRMGWKRRAVEGDVRRLRWIVFGGAVSGTDLGSSLAAAPRVRCIGPARWRSWRGSRRRARGGRRRGRGRLSGAAAGPTWRAAWCRDRVVRRAARLCLGGRRCWHERGRSRSRQGWARARAAERHATTTALFRSAEGALALGPTLGGWAEVRGNWPLRGWGRRAKAQRDLLLRNPDLRTRPPITNTRVPNPNLGCMSSCVVRLITDLACFNLGLFSESFRRALLTHCPYP